MKPSLTCEVLTFKPNLQSMLWGGDTLPRLKGIAVPGTPVGESWEVSAMPGKESVVADGPLEGRNLAELAADYGAELLGEESIRRYGLRFPLLVKFIDARRDSRYKYIPTTASPANCTAATAKQKCGMCSAPNPAPM